MSVNQFKPAWWLPSCHLQTLWPALCRRSVKITLQRERVETPDNDFIDLDWVKPTKPLHANAPLILILHGLEGNIDSHYAKGMMQAISNAGGRAVFMHFRGCSGEPNRLTKNYHSGETNDVSYMIKLIQSRYPQAELGVIGYSLGGNVLLKWLGETRWQNPLKAAVAVSVPFDLHKAVKRFQQGFSKFYQWYLIKCLRTRLTAKYRENPEMVDPSILNAVRTMYEFDDKITAPLHGFAGVNEYYATASCRQFLKSIQVPTLILHSKDDPFMSEDIIPTRDEISDCVNLEITERGGHVGFVSGTYPWRPQYWLEARALAFLQSALKFP